MHEVGSFEAKNKLGTLLDWVAKGEDVLITRHGKPAAMLVPVTPHVDRNKSVQAAQGLLKASRGITLGGINLKSLVDEGRP